MPITCNGLLNKIETLTTAILLRLYSRYADVKYNKIDFLIKETQRYSSFYVVIEVKAIAKKEIINKRSKCKDIRGNIKK